MLIYANLPLIYIYTQTLYRELQAEGTLPPMGLPDEAGIAAAAAAAPMEKEDATRRARRSSTEMYDDEDATTRARRSSTGIQCSDEDVSLSCSYTQGVVYIYIVAVCNRNCCCVPFGCPCLVCFPALIPPTAKHRLATVVAIQGPPRMPASTWTGTQWYTPRMTLVSCIAREIY